LFKIKSVLFCIIKIIFIIACHEQNKEKQPSPFYAKLFEYVFLKKEMAEEFIKKFFPKPLLDKKNMFNV
jgi:hypothetical protein